LFRVRRASYAIRLPAQANEAGWIADFTIPGKQPSPGEQFFRFKYTMVGPLYFETMGTRIRQGRGIDDGDSSNARAVAVINESMARRLWPDENPIGKVIVMGRRSPIPREIVGVAEDNKIASLYEEQQPYVYVPYAQDPQMFGLLLVESDGELRDTIAAVRSIIADMDAGLPILDVGSLQAHMDLVLYEQRRDAWVAAGVGVLGLFLAIVGVYGVISLDTARRTKEIGIRIALGSPRAGVVYLVVRRVIRLAVIGMTAGIAGGVAAGYLLRSRLHGIESSDGWTILTCAGTLIVAAVVAAAAPSWQAAHVDPATALRSE
jgi:hypothetical protein